MSFVKMTPETSNMFKGVFHLLGKITKKFQQNMLVDSKLDLKKFILWSNI